ncbi:FecR family protein [Aquimarina longa]|uniref:FecR family protein n=1 Tax=Aquimarina longa TaxID=1080221 RepID=UPI000783778A|nr:FecR family protein [Aquimarina longa]
MKITKELLQRYAENKCTPNEKEAILDWLSEIEGDIPNSIIEENKAPIKDMWEHIAKKTIEKNETSKNSRVISIQKWKKIAVAASLALLLSLSWFGRTYLTIPFVTQKNIALAPGEEANLHLQDNSKIQLRSASVLEYPSFFAGKNREVKLVNGEAYFKIASDPEHPFVVHTDSVNITVLGTQFNIANYPLQDQIMITLVEGKIQFKSKEKTVILTPDQQLIYNKKTGDTQLYSNINTAQAIAWTKGELWFDNTPLQEVLNTLERQYEVRFITKKQWNLPLTAKFKKQSLNRTLYLLEKSTGLKFTRKGKEITVTQ